MGRRVSVSAGPSAFVVAIVAALATAAVGLHFSGASAQAPTPAQVGQWSARVDWPLVAIHQVPLHTGEVLMFDGYPPVHGGVTARLWNPSTGSFLSVPTTDDLWCAGHTLLADGRAFVAGGYNSSNPLGIRDANIFDPGSRTWTPVSPMAYRRWYPTTTTLPDGRVLVVSGADTCETCYVEVPEVYDPAVDSWTQLTGARLNIAMYPYMFVLPDGRLLSAGTYEFPDATRVLDIPSQTWTVVDPTILDAGSAAMYEPGKVIKSGKTANASAPYFPSTRTTYVLDLTSGVGSWHEAAPMGHARAYHVLTMLPDGSVLATGGGRTTDPRDESRAVFEAEIWNPLTETWTTMAPMTVPRLYHSAATLLPDGRVVVAGGGRYLGPDHLDAEVFSPPYLFKGARPAVGMAPGAITFGNTFEVTTPDAASITQVNLLRPGATTHSFNHDQRFLRLSFQTGPTGVTIQAPDNPNLAPPGYYLLYLVNAQGVPSVGAYVHLGLGSGVPTLSIGDATVTEGNTGTTTAAFSVTLSQALTVPVSVAYATSNGTASTGDYTTTSGTLVLAAGQTSATVSVPVIGDTTFEPNETFNVTLSNVVNAVLLRPAGVGTIVNDDVSPGGGGAGLVAAYAFDETTGATASDASGNNLVGTVSGAAWTAGGRHGGALAFDGINDLVTVLDAAPLDLTTGMTLEAWVYPATSSNWRTVILKEMPGDLVYALYNSSDTGRPAGYARTASIQAVNGPSALAINTWSHLAVTLGGGSMRLYVNGTEVGATSVAGALTASGLPLRIGGNNVWSEYFSGRLDDVRVYNRALSSTEIQTDMATPVGSGTSVPAVSIADVVLNEGVGWSTAVFTVSLSAATTEAVSVNYATVDGSAVAGADYATLAGTATFLPGETSRSLNVRVYGDDVPEPDEAFTVALSSPVGMTIADALATATIVNDDVPPDVIAPTVASRAPPPGASGVSTSATVSATFSEAVLAVSVTSVTFTLRASGTDADVVATVAVSGPTATLTPSAPLSTGTIYQATLASDIADLAGNPLGAPVVWTFTTRAVTPAGLVAAYAFDETAGVTATDASVNDLGGTVSGALWTAAGRNGGALSFDGVNDWVTVPDAAPIDLTTAMTLEAWVYPTTTTGWRTVVAKESATSRQYALFSSNNTGLTSGFARASAAYTLNGPAALPVNTWSHLAVTYGGGSMRLYVNGVQVATRTGSGNIATSTQPLRIGGNAPSGQYFAGRLDDLRVYNRALSATEIQADMTTPVGSTPPPPPLPTLSIGDVSAAEGSTGLSTFTFPVTLSAASATAVSASYASTDGSATAGIDYGAVSGTVTFAPGQTSQAIAVSVMGDVAVEASETFTLTLSAPTGATLADGLATGTIINDDVAPDTTAPTLTGRTPAVGATGVATATTVTAQFSEAVLAASVSPTTFALRASEASSDVAATVSVSGSTATLMPSAALQASTLYQVTVAGSITDLAGNPLGTAVTWSFTTGAVPPPATGLVAAYAFDEGAGTTAADVSGNALTGTLTGATWTTAGRNGGALSFDGVNDWVTVADAAALDLTTALTLEAWVYPTTASGWRTVVLKEVTGELRYGLYSGSDTGQPAGYLWTTASQGLNGPAALPTNTWSHLALTYGGGAMRLYVNGVQVATRALTGAVAVSGQPLRMGGNSVWGEYFAGRLDDVRVYNRVLSAAEIQTDMTTPVGGIPPPPPLPTLGIGDVSAAEGSTGLSTFTFPVTLSAASSTAVSASYASADGSATAGIDYGAVSGTITFAPGQTSQAIAVSVMGDTVVEADETFTIILSAPTGATLADDLATGTILNDDVAPDTTTPTVTGRTPAAGATGVATATTVTAQFSEAVLAASVTPATFGLRASEASSDVAATVSVSGSTATLTPSAALQASTLYQVTVAGSITDLAGNPLGTAVTWSFTTGAVPPPATGLVAAYAFDEGSGTTAADVSGNALTGTLTGATWTTAGRHGGALSFDGVNDWVTVADAAALDLTTALTLEAWVYPTTASGWRTVVLKEVTGELQYALYSGSDTGQPAGYLRTTASQGLYGPSGLPGNTWSHVALTYGSGAMRLYVNGVQVATRTLSGSIAVSAQPLRMGGNSVWGEYFAGRIDDVRIYNRALSATEIQTDMATPVVGGPPTPTFTVSGGITPSEYGDGTSVTLSGETSMFATADAGGQFAIAGVPDGTYTATPSRAGAIFTPVSRLVTVSGANVTGVDFTAEAAPAGPLALVQRAANGFEPSVNTVSATFPTPNTAGNFLIVTGTAARPEGTLTITDTLGNTYIPAIGPVYDPAQEVAAYIWYVPSARAGANTVTLTPTSPRALEIHISEWSGIASVSPLDQTGWAVGVGTLASSGTVTTTSSGQLVFGYTFIRRDATAGTGFTPLSLVNGDLDEYVVQGAAGPIAATFTQATPEEWIVLVATFRPASNPTP